MSTEPAFTQVNSTQWQADPGIRDVLSQSGDIYTLQTPAGWKYNFQRLISDRKVSYQLQNFEDSQGHTYTLNYSLSGNLIQINEPAGRHLKVNYQTLSIKQGKATVISSVQSSDGRSVTYGYQEMADVISPSTLSYQVLSTVSYGDNTQAQYGYAQMFTSAPPLLTTIIDPRYPYPFTQIRNEYDTSATNQVGRILHQYNYNTGATVFSLSAIDATNYQAIDSRGVVHTVRTTTKGLVKYKVDGNSSTGSHGLIIRTAPTKHFPTTVLGRF